MFQLLYVSHLASGADFTVVKEVVSVARERNPARGITGALLFDGERFCQLLEGTDDGVRETMKSIACDPRHTAVSVLHSDRADGRRQLGRWVSGYCEPTELEPFVGAAGLRGSPALQAFLRVLRGADVE